MKKIVTLSFMTILFISLFVACHAEKKHCASLLKEIDKTPQNANYFLPSQHYRITQTQKIQLKKQYLSHYFLPWKKPFSVIPHNDLLTAEKDYLDFYQHHASYGENLNLHDPAWINRIKINMQLSHFPNQSLKAIVINTTPLRVLPTQSPAFDDPTKAGQGYPFDELQNTTLNPNELIYIVHTTQDHAWSLVITSMQSWGWVHSKDIAITSFYFRKKWEAQKNYVTPTQDHAPILGLDKQFYFQTHLGEIYPLVKVYKNRTDILVADRNSHGKAIISLATLPPKIAKKWPVTASTTNIAHWANKFLGKPYGWGDFNNDRDCSQTLKDLFAPFSIWLPRNSQFQATQDNFISLANKSPAEKQEMILKNGIPFFTLLWLDGHIMLYIGEHAHHLYVFHSPWGIHTQFLFFKGRDIIGRTVITPLDLGKHCYNVPKTWLEKLLGMRIILNPPPSSHQS